MMIPTKRIDEFRNLRPGELFVCLCDAHDTDIWCKTPFANMQDEVRNNYHNADGAFCTAYCINEDKYMQCNPKAKVVVIDIERIKERLAE